MLIRFNHPVVDALSCSVQGALVALAANGIKKAMVVNPLYGALGGTLFSISQQIFQEWSDRVLPQRNFERDLFEFKGPFKKFIGFEFKIGTCNITDLLALFTTLKGMELAKLIGKVHAVVTALGLLALGTLLVGTVYTLVNKHLSKSSTTSVAQAAKPVEVEGNTLEFPTNSFFNRISLGGHLSAALKRITFLDSSKYSSVFREDPAMRLIYNSEGKELTITPKEGEALTSNVKFVCIFDGTPCDETKKALATEFPRGKHGLVLFGSKYFDATIT